MEFQLRQKDILLGTLRSYDFDFPWINCKFEPTEAFQAVKPLFDEEVRLINDEDMENWETVYLRIDELNLKLINVENDNVIDDFLLHIENDEAWFRYIDS